jgi:hypothetical protein
MKNGNIWRGYLEPLIYVMTKKFMHGGQVVSVNHESWATMCHGKLGYLKWRMSSLFVAVVAKALIQLS